MKAHAASNLNDRKDWFEEIRQEIQGRDPKGPFSFALSLEFTELVADKIDKTKPTPLEDRFKRALYRDCRYATAGPVYMRLLGLNQAMRSVYDGGRQLIDGGVE